MEPENSNQVKEVSRVKWTAVKLLALIVLLTFLLGIVSLSIWMTREYQRVSIQYGMNTFYYKNSKRGVVYSADGVVLTHLYEINKEYVPLDRIAKPMQDAIIAIEDHRFYHHFGVDFIGTARALYRNLREGQVVEGGSTITQQLVRNLFLTPEKTLSRKMTEVLLAVNFERKFTKEQILEMYLNEIFLGNGCYGVEAASQKYFNKQAGELNLVEASMLAAIPKAPNRYEPLKNRKANRSRQEAILNRMVELNMIDRQEADIALGMQINLKDYTVAEGKIPYKFPYFTTEVINQLIEMYGRKKVYNGGLTVITTLDSRAAKIAEELAKQKVEQFKKSGITAGNLAIVSVSTKDGAVLSLVGGSDFSKDQNNLAVIPRQPGSAIKPLNYAGALEKGVINENSMLNAKTKRFGKYEVTSKENGNVSVALALKYSINVPAVEVVNILGIERTMDNLKRFGINTVSPYDYNLSVGLGGMYHGIKPLEMAAAYAAFASSGIYHKPYLVKSVEDDQGVKLYQHKIEYRRILSPRTAQVMTQILQEAVRGGTGTRANISGFEAGKTGTTNDSRCLWFVGFNKELSTAVWVGNSDNRPVYGYYGGDLAAPVWREYTTALIKNQIIGKPARIYPTVLPIKIMKEEIKEENANLPKPAEKPQTPAELDSPNKVDTAPGQAGP